MTTSSACDCAERAAALMAEFARAFPAEIRALEAEVEPTVWPAWLGPEPVKRGQVQSRRRNVVPLCKARPSATTDPTGVAQLHVERSPRWLMAKPVRTTRQRPERKVVMRSTRCPCGLLGLYFDGETGLVTCALECGFSMAEGEFEAIYGRDEFREDTYRHPSVVYYMRLDSLVKIGFSVSLAGRVHAINPQGVMAIEWGGRKVEQQRHTQFGRLHVHGEWFRLTAELAAHIVMVRADFERDLNTTTEAWLADVGIRSWQAGG